MPFAPSASASAWMRELAQQRRDVGAVAAHLLVQLVLAQVGGGEVAEVLVDPVRRQPADDAVLPPDGALHVLAPLVRGVPVVAHVVVVEDHRAGDGRHQPAHVRVGPRLEVEPGVLLEVGDLEARAVVVISRLARMRRRVASDVSSAYTWSPSMRMPSGQLVLVLPRRGRGRSGEGVGVEVPVVELRRGAAVAARAEREPDLARHRPGCGSATAGGRSRSGGQTCSPSRRTSYGGRGAGSRPATVTSA